MKIYNIDKTQELLAQDIDLTLGRLIEDEIVIKHDAIQSVPEKGHYKVVAEYSNGGKDVEWVIDEPGIEGREAYEEKIPCHIYKPYSEEYVHNHHILETIEALKRELAAGDYKIIKRFEGYYTDEEFEEIRAERKAMRDEINILESQLYESIPEDEENIFQ